MTFLDRATPYIRFGIPVFPLEPRGKKPIAGFARWPDLASTDPKQIAAWNAENPNANCGLVAKEDGFLILEFDIASGMRDAAAAMGQPIPLTRAHRSGGGFGHWVFKQTDRACQVGNRSVNRPEPCSDPNCPKAEPGKTHHHEWFSFRQHNRYVVGPGSIHPNGNKYTVAREMTPIPCPDWVCDFVEKHSVSERPVLTEDRVSVNEDFDFDSLMEWYGIEIASVDGSWYSPAECPVKGGPHTEVTDCGFWYDGDTLGWHDFSQGCEGSHMTIGAVLRHLNQDHEPYPERIWPGEGLDWLEDDEIITIEPEPEAAARVTTTLSAASRANLAEVLAEADRDEAEEEPPALPGFQSLEERKAATVETLHPAASECIVWLARRASEALRLAVGAGVSRNLDLLQRAARPTRHTREPLLALLRGNYDGWRRQEHNPQPLSQRAGHAARHRLRGCHHRWCWWPVSAVG
jgi:hypothetical protein